MQQAKGALFSLGGAIWGFAAAAGHSSPQEQVPEAWLLILIEKHADAEFFLCLFRASRGARDWVLVTAPRAQLCFRSGTGPWSRLLSSARQALLTRGAKPVRVRVVARACEPDATGLAALPCFLEGAGAGITALDVRCSAQTPVLQQVAAVFIQLTALQLANLTTLSLQCSPRCPTLPNPTLIPKLRHLNIQDVEAAQCQSIAPYLPQLITLTLRHSPNAAAHDLVLFSPATATHTLTHFNTNGSLNDQLLTLLLDHATALKELTVGRLRLTSNRHRTRQWAVEVLCICTDPDVPLEAMDPLCCLPNRPNGQTLIRPRSIYPWLQFTVTTPQGLSSGFCERLHQWRFDPKCNFKIVAGPGLPHPEHPSALRTVLRQVQGVDTTGPLRLRLTGWHLDPSDAAHIYVERLPSLHQFNVHVECGRLTDELLSALLSAPTCDTVSANKFHLSSNHHTETWRIGTLWLSCLKATQLNKLPGPPPRCDLRCKELRMDNLLHVDHERLRAWLACVCCFAQQPLTIRLQCPPDYPTDQALTLLQAQLTELQAVRPGRVGRALVNIYLEGWPLTNEVMSALQGLPQWPCVLHIRDSQWPLEPDEYRTLAQYIPTSYHTWHLEASQVSLTQAEQVVLGIKEHRASLIPAVTQSVQVCVSDTHTATRLRGLVGDSEHVKVTLQGEAV